ncbi:hypothetical protein [Actinoalloteichus fjordicus]|uniref:Uncharacterized protein n=1 Tax=Actinoalloteichus fjordicus TaxID=1612552 RepID=A0AAC9LBV7_9PSEU|nr:hypothetical protein [Actinoalloteichus fjordicus]APU13555.1 hypothetical protein UA74_07430 [Actinoalloteichus fjordicus]
MSVTDVVAQLRQAHALLTAARLATAQADAAIVDGAMIFAAATAGSTQPEVAGIADLARLSSEDVRTADALFAQTQALIDTYCHDIAGVGAGEPTAADFRGRATEEAVPSHPPASATTDETEPPEVRYAGWIAELRRSGAKISPERVIRMTRHRDGRLVWLEEGHENSSGRAHILRPERIDEFAGSGIPERRVLDVIFNEIENGSLVRTSGNGGEVYEVPTEVGPRLIKIVIASNGYIVTSHPMGRRRG